MIPLSDIPVAILAGGLATRLLPWTQTVPKSLLPISGAPFLEHQLVLLRSEGIRRVVVCGGYMGQQIERYFGNGLGWDMDLYYSYDGASMLGTAGALRKALPLLGKRFFVLNGDSYLPTDLTPIMEAFRAGNCPALMTVRRNSDAGSGNKVHLENGRIQALDKAASHMEYSEYGLSLLTPEALADVPAGVPYDLGTVFRKWILESKLAGFEVFDRRYEIGSSRGMTELETMLNGVAAA